MRYFVFLIVILLFSSCEDVIDLPLTEGSKRLVIDANINWEKETDGNEQIIRLSETRGFYEETSVLVDADSVYISSGSDKFIFAKQTSGKHEGLYKTNSFIPEIEREYTLVVKYKGETYTATEILKGITNIKDTEQSVQNVFGKNSIRVDFNYTDPGQEENYYLSEMNSNAFLLNQYWVWRDEFIDGNDDSVFIINEDLKVGDAVTLSFYGISKEYHDYMKLLFEQVTPNGPFATTPSAVKGNCINETNPKNKPLGYFRLCQIDKETHIIK